MAVGTRHGIHELPEGSVPYWIIGKRSCVFGNARQHAFRQAEHEWRRNRLMSVVLVSGNRPPGSYSVLRGVSGGDPGAAEPVTRLQIVGLGEG
jgi:hypothetical protein